MAGKTPNTRTPECEVDSIFTDRWSPRAFSSEPLPDQQVKALFEAARWAPSCFNEQPWLFVYATEPEKREILVSALTPKNRRWAAKCPMLMFALARKNFKQGGTENRHAAFDTGAAWLSLALQARRLGLYAHAMAGFIQEKAYEVLGVSKDEYHVMAAIAVGRKVESIDGLPEDLRGKESPNARKPPSEVATDKFPIIS
jgi:nitroreductase